MSSSLWPNTAFCTGRNFDWNGGDVYSRSGGHWACFTDHGKIPPPNFDEYDIGFGECMGYAKWSNVPKEKMADWCGGWPNGSSFYRTADPPPESEISLLLPVVLLLVGGGLLYWYLYV